MNQVKDLKMGSLKPHKISLKKKKKELLTRGSQWRDYGASVILTTKCPPPSRMDQCVQTLRVLETMKEERVPTHKATQLCEPLTFFHRPCSPTS